jgi:hypothetical protein
MPPLALLCVFSRVSPPLLRALVLPCARALPRSRQDPRTLPCYEILCAAAGLDNYSSLSAFVW